MPTVTARVRRQMLHERFQMAVKAALAAALSWVVADLVAGAVPGQGLEGYLYYAPLGAVVATYPTVADSARTAARSALALGLGAGLGLAVHQLLPQNVGTLALVVGAGVALGALPVLGEQRSWVPIVALFVLVIGGGNTTAYAAAYVGLTAIGALCGVLVNVLLPATRLTPASEALARARAALAGELDAMADALGAEPPPGGRDWQRRLRDVAPVVAEMRRSVDHAVDARLGNPRARRHAAEADRQQAVAQALGRVAFLVEELVGALADSHRADLQGSPLDAELRVATAGALRHLAALVRAYDPGLDVDDPRVRDARRATEQLTATFGRRRDLDPSDVAVLGVIVANLQRATAAVAPRRDAP